MALDRDQIHYGVDGQTHGPVDLSTLQQLLKEGRLHADDYLWDPDLENWIAIRRYPFLLSAETVDEREDETPAGAPPPLWSVAVDEPAAAAQDELPYGGVIARIVAWVLDLLVMLVPVMVLEAVLQSRYDIDWNTFWVPFLEQYFGLDPAARSSSIVLDAEQMALGMRFVRELQLGTIVLRGLYWTLFESSPLQGTLGKRIMGLVVTDAHGRRIPWTRAALRFVGRLLCEFTLGIGYVVMLFHERRQGLHDLIARTLVLRR